MVRQINPMEIAEVRETAAQFVGDEPTPIGSVQSARHAVQTMCEEAAGYGLTTVDVIRAILTPAFETRRGCDCSVCRDRRNEVTQRKSERVSTPVF